MDSIQFIADKAGRDRTSKHTWCKGDCTKDLVIVGIDAKIQHITGIPATKHTRTSTIWRIRKHIQVFVS